MDNFWSSLRQAFGHLGTIRVMDIVDILLVAAFFYFLITLVRRTKTNKLFQGIVYILLALWLSGEMQLYTVNYILRNAVQIGLLSLVVLFQPEIRRFLEKLGAGFGQKKGSGLLSQIGSKKILATCYSPAPK